MTPPTQPRDLRSSVDKAMALLNAFGEDGVTGVGVSELSRRADMSKSTAFRLLSTLQNNDAVERAGSAYRLGRMIRTLGVPKESEAHGRLRDALTPFLASLFEHTRQTVHLAVLDGTDVRYLNKLYGLLAVRSPSRTGGRAPAHCTGVGKVLLAFSPAATRQVLSEPLLAWTPQTITDPEKFRVELAEIQRTRLAYDREEILTGLHCIAAPIVNSANVPVAAMSISGPVGKFVPENQADVLRKVCYEASRTVSAFEPQPTPRRRDL